MEGYDAKFYGHNMEYIALSYVPYALGISCSLSHARLNVKTLYYSAQLVN